MSPPATRFDPADIVDAAAAHNRQEPVTAGDTLDDVKVPDTLELATGDFKHIRKRDGRLVEFDPAKIWHAITAAGGDVYAGRDFLNAAGDGGVWSEAPSERVEGRSRREIRRSGRLERPGLRGPRTWSGGVGDSTTHRARTGFLWVGVWQQYTTAHLLQ